MFTVSCGVKKCDGVDGLIRLLIDIICQGIHTAGQQRLCFLPGAVLVGKKGFEICPIFLAIGFEFQQ